MKGSRHIVVWLLMPASYVVWAVPTWGDVLCQKRSGVVVVRTACKKKEKPLDLAQFGAVGPKGDKGDPGPPGVGPLTACAPDAVLVGTACVDKYEASAWQIPPSNTDLVAKLKRGEATLADLTAGGAVQLGCPSAPSNHAAYPPTFPVTGNWTEPVYAASIAGVLPSECTSWFQAAQACALSGKRLVTNDEWQRASAGTPDGTDDAAAECNTNNGGAGVGQQVNTGSRANCVSRWGAFDMVGNVSEWVADWGDSASDCTDWLTGTGFSDGDLSCVGGPGGAGFLSLPAATYRGGNWNDGAGAGPLAVQSDLSPFSILGFRCAR